MRRIPSASQTVGPFFAIGFDWLTTPPPPDDIPSLRGVVRDGDGSTVRDAVLEVWTPAVEGHARWLRVATSDDGKFGWPLPAELPRHWSVLLFTRGLLRPLLTRVYPPGHPPADDAVWDSVPAARRITLQARENLERAGCYWWDIHLQDTPAGGQETVFFDCHSPSR